MKLVLAVGCLAVAVACGSPPTSPSQQFFRVTTYVSLSPGIYSAYVKVPSNEYKFQSDAVRFTIQ